MKLLNINSKIEFTKKYIKSYDNYVGDFRYTINPKNNFNDDDFTPSEYYQVFATKNGFIPNLSIIDLLFNMGNDSVEKLKS